MKKIIIYFIVCLITLCMCTYMIVNAINNIANN